MADTKTKLPNIPDVSSVSDLSLPLRTLLASIVVTLQILLGRTKNGSSDDQLVTFRDLQANDTAKRYMSDAVSASSSSTGQSPTVVVLPHDADGSLVDRTPPPSLSNVVVSSSPTSVIASFDLPVYYNAFTGMSNHAYTMLYMADANADGTSPGFGNAIASGQSNGPIIYLPIGAGRHVYVWLRNFSKADIPGPLYGGAGGVEITTPVSLNIVDSLLAITPQSPFKVLDKPTTINGITYPEGVYIKGAYVDEIDALIAKFGTASIDQAKIGTLSVQKLDATTMTAAFAQAVTAQFQDLSAQNANLGDTNTKGWLTATGKGTAYGGIRSSVGKWWQSSDSGYIFASESDGKCFMEFKGGYSYIRMCSWGDNSICFADNAGNVKLSIDNAGNLFVAGTLGNMRGGFLQSNDGQSWINLNTTGSDWLLVSGGRGLIRANGQTNFNNTMYDNWISFGEGDWMMNAEIADNRMIDTGIQLSTSDLATMTIVPHVAGFSAYDSANQTWVSSDAPVWFESLWFQADVFTKLVASNVWRVYIRVTPGIVVDGSWGAGVQTYIRSLRIVTQYLR